METKSNSEILPSDFVKSAAFLRREFLGRNRFRGKSTNSDHIKTIYVYDTDIIVTKCAPWRNGPSSQNAGGGYGEILTGRGVLNANNRMHERELRAIKTAAILSDHVLDKIRPTTMPLYQFSGHFSETEHVFTTVRKKAGHISKVELKEMKLRKRHALVRATAVISSRLNGGDTVKSTTLILDHLLDVLSDSNGYPPPKTKRVLAQWDNFLQLNIRSGGIYPLNLGVEHFSGADQFLMSALDVLNKDNQTLTEERLYSDLFSLWSKKLHEFKPKSSNIEHDARALTELYLVNARLKNSDWRLVFVTGDRAMIEAGYRTKIKGVSGVDPEVAKIFSQKYIRHLWAYTNDALIEPDSIYANPEEIFVKWLDGLLANWSSKTKFQEADLNHLISYPGRSLIDKPSVSKALSKWASLTEKSIKNSQLDEYGRKDIGYSELRSKILTQINLADDRRNKIGRSTPLTWQDLILEIQEIYDRYKDRTFLVLSNIGTGVIIKAKKAGQRNPPSLTFDSLDHTRDIFEKLCSTDGYADTSEFENDYNNIGLDCHKSKLDGDDRQESHLKYLVLGAAFASANCWSVALSQAQLAVSIIERSIDRNIMPILVRKVDEKGDSKKSHMSGREAYFLCASSQRMIAKNNIDFANAERYLLKAEKSLKKDHKENTAQNITNLRFMCERLALFLSRYYFERKRNESDYCDDHVKKLFSTTELLLEKVRELEPNSIGFSNGSNLKRFGKVPLVHIATNLIQVAVINKFREKDKATNNLISPVSNDILEEALGVLCKLTAQPATDNQKATKVIETTLMHFYKDAAARLLNSRSYKFAKTVTEIEKLFENAKLASVTEYDDWRFGKLKELAIRLSLAE